jgi:uncharacterized protein YjbI with pentapeptide repeats
VADEEQVKLLKEKGVRAWNDWRKANPGIRPDLRWAELPRAKLLGANLCWADLSEAFLAEANLSRADLNDAALCGADLRGAKLHRADLGGADLAGANLSYKFDDLRSRVDLSGANLRGARLFQTDLRGANLSDADLLVANLEGANLSGANLNQANLRGADLENANLHGAKLVGTNLDQAKIAYTNFGYVDLSRTIGLDAVRHIGPAEIGISTIYRSGGNISEPFLRGAGVPEPFIGYMKSLVAAMAPYEFYSCFISYSHADKAFARRLYDMLQSKGVRCWLDEHQLLPGDDIYHEVDRGIRLWDKMLLCCSENSLKSWWVDNEIGTAFEKEQQLMKEREGKVHVLVPLNLDGYLFSDKWKSGYQAQVRRRLAADFTESGEDMKKFDEQVERLIKALRADEGAREKPPKQRL